MKYNATERLLRRKEVEGLTGLSRTTLYYLIQQGRFPRPVPLAGRTVAWPESAVRAWIEERMKSGTAA